MTSLFKSTTTYDPIDGLLNCEDEKKQDELTQRWKDNKLNELNFVGVVGALLAGVLTSTGSWPTILPNGKPSPWTVRACWYCGIIFALSAVLSALQQSIRLHRLACHEHANTSIRRLLRKARRSKDGRWHPRMAQVCTWQMSAHLLTLSALAMFASIFILIWSATGRVDLTNLSHPERDWWNNDSKLAVTFTIVATCIGALFVFHQITLYTFAGADDSDGSEAKHG